MRDQFIYNAGMHQESEPARGTVLDKPLIAAQPGSDFATKLGFSDLANTLRPPARITAPFKDAGHFDNPVFDTRQLIGWKGRIALPETGIVLSDVFADRVGPYISKLLDDHIALGYPTKDVAIILDYRQGMQGGHNQFDAPNSDRKHFDAIAQQMIDGTEIKTNIYTRSTVQQTAYWNGIFTIDPLKRDPSIFQFNDYVDYEVGLQLGNTTKLTCSADEAIQSDRLHIHNKQVGINPEMRIFAQVEIRPARPEDYYGLETENPHLHRAVQAARFQP